MLPNLSAMSLGTVAPVDEVEDDPTYVPFEQDADEQEPYVAFEGAEDDDDETKDEAYTRVKELYERLAQLKSSENRDFFLGDDDDEGGLDGAQALITTAEGELLDAAEAKWPLLTSLEPSGMNDDEILELLRRSTRTEKELELLDIIIGDHYGGPDPEVYYEEDEDIKAFLTRAKVQLDETVLEDDYIPFDPKKVPDTRPSPERDSPNTRPPRTRYLDPPLRTYKPRNGRRGSRYRTWANESGGRRTVAYEERPGSGAY